VLFKESQLPLVVSSGRPSINNTSNFPKETDYHNSLHSTNIPLPRPSSKGGFFEEGSSIILRNNARLVKVLGVAGVGHNYFMMGLKDSGRALEGKMTLWRMVVSIEPSHF